MTPLLALLTLQGAPIDPSTDAAFAKPVTLRLAMTPLKEVVSQLSKAAGQPLDIATSVSDLKATVLVKDLPAGRTMEAIADTFNLVWQKETGGYLRLTRAEGGLSGETAYRNEEKKAYQKTPPAGGRPSATVSGVRGSTTNRRGRAATVVVAAAPAAIRYDANLLSLESAGGAPISRLNPPTASGTSAFAKAVLAWPSVPERPSAAWLKPTGGILLEPSSWSKGQYALSDLLLGWHLATNLPVVADAFRIGMNSRSVPIGGALESLQSLAGSERLQLKLADGVARLRHPAFWRLREQEIPATRWRMIEAKGAATLDNFATFASGLNAAQIAAFRSAEVPLSTVTTDPLRTAMPFLVLWAQLPTAARQALYNGQPVALSAVPGVRNAYLNALNEAPYYGAGDPTPVLRLAVNQIGLFGKGDAKSLDVRLGSEAGVGVTYGVRLF